jgi:peroxiredoxin Q/BCP
MVVQRYKIFLLFIFILNYFVSSCTGSDKNPGLQAGAKTKSMTNVIEVGSKAPDFSLPDQTGKRVNLTDFLGKVNIVVFFYPKDESFGCTKEACGFRDAYEDFKEAGAEVIGISADDIASHQAFAANHKLPFILLSDKGKAVAEKYNVGKSLGVIPGRVTYVIDKDGIIRMVFSSQINFQKHIDEALAVLKQLKTQESR